VCTGYHGGRLDQKTMTRVVRAYGHLERWMDAIELFADYVQEAGLGDAAADDRSRAAALAASGAGAGAGSGEAGTGAAHINIRGGRKVENIDMVLTVVMEVLAQHGQERLIPNVLSRLVEKGIPISEAPLKEAFRLTASANATVTRNTHAQLFRVALISGYPEEAIRRAYKRGTRGKTAWLEKGQKRRGAGRSRDEIVGMY
jgi:hypothetical protein